MISTAAPFQTYSTVLGSVPKGTFCGACTGLKSSASSFLRASSAFFFSSCAFFRSSASFYECQKTATNITGRYLCFCTDSCCGLLLLDLLNELLYFFRFVFLRLATAKCELQGHTFFKPKVLSTATLGPGFGCSFFFGGMIRHRRFSVVELSASWSENYLQFDCNLD